MSEQNLAFPGEPFSTEVGEYSFKITRLSANYKDNALEGFYVLRDYKCDCDKGMRRYVNSVDKNIVVDVKCSDCNGQGYVTKKILLSELGLA